MVKSNITGKTYSPDNNSVVYLSNPRQSFLYLKNGGDVDLVDILYMNTKKDCLVFVFEKTEHIKHLYDLWNSHELE